MAKTPEQEAPLKDDEREKWLNNEQSKGGSLYLPLHGRRRVKTYQMSDSDIDLLSVHSGLAAFGVTVIIFAGGLIAAATWDVISVGVKNPENAKLYMKVCWLGGILGIVLTIAGFIFRFMTKRRVQRETEF